MATFGLGLRVLIVDDSDDDATFVLHQLRKQGTGVVQTERVDSEVGLRRALERPWDVVICDYSMPGFSGSEALRVVRAQSRWLPFVMVSGTVGEDFAVEILKAGADDYLLKDSLIRLSAAIERAVDSGLERARREAAETALRESEARFRLLVSSMEDLVFTMDRRQQYTGVYGRWPGGVSDGSIVVGKSARELFGDDLARPHEEAAERAFRGEDVVYDWTLKGPAGSQYLQLRLSPLRTADGAIIGAVGVGRDLTAQKQLQVQLATADRMASVGLLAAGIAHEINNPLAAVLANVGLTLQRLSLQRDTDGGVTDSIDELKDVLDASERIARIVRDLSLFSRAPDERLSLVDVRQVADSALRLADNQIRHRARIVRRYLEVPLVRVNESRLGQVFLNLVINAAQAIPVGRSEVHVVTVTTRAERADEVIVEVQDSGVGMTPETRERLFTPFFTTKGIGLGTGLGLSICQRIITSFGGSIEVDSELGQGSTFRVKLPAAPPNELPAPSKRLVATQGPIERRGRVLVVDDDAQVLRVVARCLEPMADVVAVESVKRALERLASGTRFDVVVCDLMMPEQTGIDLYHELKRHYPALATAMVFLSGGTFSGSERDFLDRVPNRWVEKPFDRELLLAAVVASMSETPKS